MEDTPQNIQLSDPDPIGSDGDDFFDLKLVARDVQKILENVRTPYVVGIFGDWGIGKTSLLKLTIGRLKNRESNKTNIALLEEPFEAWRYEAGESLVAPLLCEISRQFELSKKSKFHKILNATSLSVSDILLKKFTGAELKDIKKYWKFYDKWTTEANRAKGEFSQLVEIILKNKKANRLVLFIDDLDRCSPDKAVNLLESIKNFLTVANTVFVIAVDSGVLASYIDEKYHGTKMDGQAYLDKIIQLSVTVPIPSELAIRDVFKKQLSPIVTLDEKCMDKISRILTSSSKLCVPRRLNKIIDRYKLYCMVHKTHDENIFRCICMHEGWTQFFYWFLNTNSSLRNYCINYIQGGTSETPVIEAIKTKVPEKLLKDEEFRAFVSVGVPGVDNKEQLRNALRCCGIL